MKNRWIQILNESKRDDLLQRFVVLLNDNGITVDIGTVKSKLLNKFVVEGNIHNLSLRSNYYLAGVARYYFDGSLTKNKNLSLLNKSFWGGEDIRDEWRTDVCAKLDALIVVLRNAYIDTIGREMLEQEDFGELPIRDLFKKYGKEIKKQLGGTLKKKAQPEIDMSNNVGNNYTFEIIYSQEDCTKYNEATSPRAWCITFSKGNYDYYIRDYNIHYVIFRQDGFEKIPRPKNPMNEPGFTPEKPQDAYGNSLIALLQSNTSPEPKLITSRWNHGYEVPCEADHAYTKEEFERITGVTDDDLKRIYEIWKLKHGSVKRSGVNKKEELFITRSLKYLQMRINAGENPQKLFDTTNRFAGSEKINKGTFVCSAKLSETTMGLNSKTVYFIFDNGKIVFESASESFYNYNLVGKGENSLIIIDFDANKKSIYSFSKHKIVSVNGMTKFKRIPNSYELRDPTLGYFTVNQGKLDAALIDMDTMEPLQLPNGDYWFSIVTSNHDEWHWNRNKIRSIVFAKRKGAILQFIADISSMEYYFYDTSAKRFIDIPKPQNSITNNNGTEISSNNLLPMFPTTGRYSTSSQIVFQDGTVPILYARPSEYGLERGNLYTNGAESQIQFIKDGKPLCINGAYWFYDIRLLMNDLYDLAIEEGNHVAINDKMEILLDKSGNILKYTEYHLGHTLVFFQIDPSNVMLYHLETRTFLKNPFKQSGYEGTCVFKGKSKFFYDYHGGLYGHGLQIMDTEAPEDLLHYNYIKVLENGFGINEENLSGLCDKVPSNFSSIKNVDKNGLVNINVNDIKEMVYEAIHKIMLGYVK